MIIISLSRDNLIMKGTFVGRTKQLPKSKSVNDYLLQRMLQIISSKQNPIMFYSFVSLT